MPDSFLCAVISKCEVYGKQSDLENSNVRNDARSGCYCSSLSLPSLLFDGTFIPLKRPNFLHMPESRFGLCVSLKGGVVGGVVGLSFAGLSVLPLSSVIPRPLPVEALASEPDAIASMFEVYIAVAGDDVLCESLVL